jgi:Zn-dependent protease
VTNADTLYLISIWLLPVLIAITFHEAAHAFVARFYGDETASRLGRVSLNPIRHIDPIGTILLPGHQDAAAGGAGGRGWSSAPSPYARGHHTTPLTTLVRSGEKPRTPATTRTPRAAGSRKFWVIVPSLFLCFPWVFGGTK